MSSIALDLPRNEPNSLWYSFLECFPRILIKSVGFPNESYHDSKLHPRQPYQILCRNVHSVWVMGLLPKFYLLNIQVPVLKVLEEELCFLQLVCWYMCGGTRQPASIRQLPCDFVRETPGDVLPLHGKHNFLLILDISTELTEFLKFQWTNNYSTYLGLRRWMAPLWWLAPCFLVRCMRELQWGDRLHLP